MIALNLKKNKKAQTTMFLFFGIILLLVVIFFLLVMGIMTSKINDALSQDIDIGSVNLATLNEQTFGMYNSMILNNADFMGVCAIFGMVLGLFLSSFFVRGRFPKWGIILDLFMIIAIFIFSIYLSQTYQHLLDALAGASEPFLEDYMPKTSMFMLNLPIYVVIIASVMMILFHSSIPRRKGEMVGGDLQSLGG